MCDCCRGVISSASYKGGSTRSKPAGNNTTATGSKGKPQESLMSRIGADLDRYHLQCSYTCIIIIIIIYYLLLFYFIIIYYYFILLLFIIILFHFILLLFIIILFHFILEKEERELKEVEIM